MVSGVSAPLTPARKATATTTRRSITPERPRTPGRQRAPATCEQPNDRKMKEELVLTQPHLDDRGFGYSENAEEVAEGADPWGGRHTLTGPCRPSQGGLTLTDATDVGHMLKEPTTKERDARDDHLLEKEEQTAVAGRCWLCRRCRVGLSCMEVARPRLVPDDEQGYTLASTTTPDPEVLARAAVASFGGMSSIFGPGK